MSSPPPPPSSLPPPMPYQSQQVSSDLEQSNLQTLSIFYFIVAGLQALIGLVPLIYVGFGILVGFVGAAGANKGGGGGAGGIMALGGMMACFGFFLSAMFWTFAFLNFTVGRSLRARKRLTLCYVMAALICLHAPLGTVLGVFTFVVLSKPGVKESFT